MFENPEIELSVLPTMEALEWRNLDASLVRLMLIRAAISLVIITGAVGAGYTIANFAAGQNGVDLRIGWVWLLPVLVAIPSLSWPFISVPRMGYSVRDKDIIFKSGVLWRTVTAIPYNRIQHVEKDSAPLDRRFDIANLKIFTAGGSGGDLKIDGLPADIAEQLRIYILDKVGAVIERH